MRIAVSGSSGPIGTALVRALREDGDEVTRLVRKEPERPDEARWDPSGTVDTAALEGVDAVVHLAGAGIGDRRWTESYKKKLRDSRVVGTRTLAEALAGLKRPPRVLVSGSAVGFYGDTAGTDADESAPMGAGFLAEMVRDWEAAAAPAAKAGIRVVHPRSGVVLTREGGLLAKVLPLFRLGLGGRLGDGRQWMSWISLPDEIAALRLLIERDDLTGPVNLTAPQPATNAEFTKALGRAVRRPAVFSVPSFALRAALDGFADEGLLISQRVLPRRLTESGFSFERPDLDSALRPDRPSA
ncbi:TIGR01777 family oxidoreductase [Actinomadura alba]|uniref:TIGR01777 family protein n=1 Tax=Actinomadura alba TaxID=406431 RepID=A0ABR7LKE5_9ACTN|nr:TIGR01777 family oxidoreductase [Actinomadura alba]MBC6465346.1 TIGR01777 family protein [Actinomadura alba]